MSTFVWLKYALLLCHGIGIGIAIVLFCGRIDRVITVRCNLCFILIIRFISKFSHSFARCIHWPFLQLHSRLTLNDDLFRMIVLCAIYQLTASIHTKQLNHETKITFSLHLHVAAQTKRFINSLKSRQLMKSHRPNSILPKTNNNRKQPASSLTHTHTQHFSWRARALGLQYSVQDCHISRSIVANRWHYGLTNSVVQYFRTFICDFRSLNQIKIIRKYSFFRTALTAAARVKTLQHIKTIKKLLFSSLLHNECRRSKEKKKTINFAN